MLNDSELLLSAKLIRADIASRFLEYRDTLNAITFRIWSMSSCAGRAFPHMKLVKLSRSYYRDHENFDRDFRDTVLHEMAHILTPGQGHNQNWKNVAVKIGCNGNRCHSLSLAQGYKKRRTLYYNVQCKCGVSKITARGHSRHCLTGTFGYYCRACSVFYKYVGEELL